MIRILVVADSASRAKSIADLLTEDERFEVVGSRTEATLDRAVPSFIDVAVVGSVRVEQVPVDSAIVLLGGEPDAEFEDERLRAALPANPSPSELAAAVIAAASDLTVLTRAQARRWLPDRANRRPARQQPTESLTTRELEVLRMLANGLGNKEIASQLGISDHTAKFHVAQILAKLSAASRTEAVMIGIRRGLIPV